MGKQFDQIGPAHQEFIEQQHIFFSGSAAPDGKVNVAPKGTDSLRVMGPNRIVWRNLTGSGNETAGHLPLNPRMTLMWCGFQARPMIMRAYGTAKCLHPRNAEFHSLNAMFPPHIGARQIYDMHVDMLQTSCGYGVPLFDHVGPRDTIDTWSNDKGRTGIDTYWHERNQHTLDGLPTHILPTDEMDEPK